MTHQDIEKQITEHLHLKLFSAIRKIIVGKERDRLTASSDYQNATKDMKDVMLKQGYKKWYEDISSFFLSRNAIYALHPLVERENKINSFASEVIYKVRADYYYDEIDFSASYPTRFTEDMQREMEDLIAELVDSKLSHVVGSYISKTDTEKAPPAPLTNSELKYSCFYLYSFSPEYTTYLSKKLHNANIITNPKTNGWNIENDFAESIISHLLRIYKSEQVLQFQRIYTDKKIDRFSKECIRPTIISTPFLPENISQTKNFLDIKFENEKESKDAILMYAFIFNITLATQMRNSIYDTSSIEIVVGSNILHEKANKVIEGEENWELIIGSIVDSILKNSTQAKDRVCVIPEIPNHTTIKPLNVYSYNYDSQRPPRYGVGRFMTQILEKRLMSNGDYEEQDAILNELLTSNALRQVKAMLIPQEISIILINWILEYMPRFLEQDYITQTNEKISEIMRA